jgi:hypothetical protein
MVRSRCYARGLMPRQMRPRRMEPVHFANPLELMRGAVEMVFGEVPRMRRNCACPTNTLRPAWYRYVQPRKSPLWKKFSPEERQRATSIIESYFASLIDSPAQDFNLLLFRGYEQQGSNFLSKILPAYKLKLGDRAWGDGGCDFGGLARHPDEGSPLRPQKERHPQAVILPRNPNEKGVGRSSSLPSSNISLSVEMAGNFCVKSCEDALLFNNRVSISAAH